MAEQHGFSAGNVMQPWAQEYYTPSFKPLKGAAHDRKSSEIDYYTLKLITLIIGRLY